MINSIDYKAIVDFVADSMQFSNDSNAELDAMPSLVAQLGYLSQVTQPFADAIATGRPAQTSPELRQAIVQLQKFVTSDSGSVNAYLLANSITVKSLFAQLSAALGYAISNAHISG